MDLGFEASSWRPASGSESGWASASESRPAPSSAEPPEPFTTTLPVISGWIAHRYENVPACLNVRFHDPPSSIGPLLNAPSFAVTVCARSSSLRNVTEPPAAIVTVAGLNARPAIDTEGDEAGAGPVDEPPPEVPPPTTIRPWYRVLSSSRSSRYVYVPLAPSASSNTTGPARDCGSRIRRVRTATACGAARCRRSRSGSSRRREPSARPAKGDR